MEDPFSTEKCPFAAGKRDAICWMRLLLADDDFHLAECVRFSDWRVEQDCL